MEKQKIRTKPQLREALKNYAQDNSEFTAMQAYEELLNRIGVSERLKLNTNRVAQLLRGVNTHEYHAGMKKWIKKRI